ncbi:MAG: hypothetical protein DRP20_05795, partial [Thermotogae bacterium]
MSFRDHTQFQDTCENAFSTPQDDLLEQEFSISKRSRSLPTRYNLIVADGLCRTGWGGTAVIIFKARNLLKHLNGTHDRGHTFRVARMARFIAEIEGADVEVVTLASLLHDIARPLEDKNTSVDHALEGAKMAADFLSQNGYEKTEQVVHAIQCHRFR